MLKRQVHPQLKFSAEAQNSPILRFASEIELSQYKAILATHNIEFRTDKRMLKYVMKGISPAYPLQEVQSELVESGFNVVEVINMVSWATSPLLMFKVTLNSEQTDLCIKEVKRVGLHKVKNRALPM